MKKLLCSFAVAVLILLAHSADAQRWLSPRGYWVVESNIRTPRESIIYFYNNENRLVYREHLSGVALAVHRRRTRKHLEKVLDQAVATWAKDHMMKEDQQWVAGRAG